MNCPKCGGAMQAVSFQDIEVDRCNSCHGIWFDALELDKLAPLAGSEIIDAPSAGATATSPSSSESRIPCPHCGGQMIGMTVHGQPHIRFESCTVCYGAFLDAGEFLDLKQESLLDRLRNFLRRKKW